MQFWKRFSPRLIRYINGYRQFFDWVKSRWEFVHRRVAEKFFGKIPKGYEVHHVDANKLNNRPKNLEVLSQEAHKEIHRYRPSLGSSAASCPRCGGLGYLPEYSHVAGGVCFRCGGTGSGYDSSENGGDVFEEEWENSSDDSDLFEYDDAPGYYDDVPEYGGAYDDWD